MPLPTPEEMRDRTKTNAQMREMMAQMAESVESKTEVENKLNSVKNYVDDNKLDLSKIIYEYVDGNKIGQKTPKYTNFGLSNAFAIQTATYYDSIVLRVKEGDLLFLLNDKQQYVSSNGAGFAFFADDPSVNRTQSRITDDRVSLTDAATSLVHQKVTVPTGAKYLMLNTRFTNAAGTVNTTFIWSIHTDAFNSSYGSGIEVISEINSTAVSTKDDVNKAKHEAIKESQKYTDEKLVIETEFDGGNIVANTGQYKKNFGVSGTLNLTANSLFDCVVISVIAGDTLCIFNDKQNYNASLGAGAAFFAQDPIANTSQTRVTHTATDQTDTESNIKYRKIVVPDGANYLLLNTRFTNSSSVRTDFLWSVHKDSFVNSYEKGNEKIKTINGLGVGYDSIPEKFNFDFLEYSSARFYNKKVFCFGDSITQGTEGGYVKYITQALNCDVSNYGSSGAAAKRLVDIITAGAGIPRRDSNTVSTNWPVKDFTQCSAVTIQIGTNDYVSGSIADIPTTDMSEYADPLEYWGLFPSNYVANIALCIEYIRSKNSECEIFLITPPYRNIDGDTPTRMSDVIPFLRAVAEHYSVPLINSMQESGIGFKYMKPNIKYSYDGIHFNALGNKLWGTYIAKKIMSSS